MQFNYSIEIKIRIFKKMFDRNQVNNSGLAKRAERLIRVFKFSTGSGSFGNKVLVIIRIASLVIIFFCRPKFVLDDPGFKDTGPRLPVVNNIA